MIECDITQDLEPYLKYVAEAYRKAVDSFLDHSHDPDLNDFLAKYENCAWAEEVPPEASEEFEDLLSRKIDTEDILSEMEADVGRFDDAQFVALSAFIAMLTASPRKNLGTVYFDSLLYSLLGIVH